MRQESAKRKESSEKGILLDPERKSPRASEFEDKLSSWIVGQERAVRRMSGLFQIYLAGMNNPSRPMPNRPGGALIGRVGETQDYFFIGDDRGAVRMRSSGRLYLGINDDNLQDNTGYFRVIVYY